MLRLDSELVTNILQNLVSTQISLSEELSILGDPQASESELQDVVHNVNKFTKSSSTIATTFINLSKYYARKGDFIKVTRFFPLTKKRPKLLGKKP